MFLKSVQEYCIFVSFCLITPLYWVPKGRMPKIIEPHYSIMELQNYFMEHHNSNMEPQIIYGTLWIIMVPQNRYGYS